MSSPTPILTPPKKPPAKVSLLPQGLESPRVMLKKYTTYVWAFVAGLPDLYSQIMALGEMPAKLKAVLWGSAAVGLAASWIKQRLDR
ncbi:hypothetical protein ACQHIH_16035 [Xanthomonas sontii]|uniref:hypothetical protein n=1 Tax=Xanthomonas sontii TaxID=2650745 RepID=UPI00388409F7